MPKNMSGQMTEKAMRKFEAKPAALGEVPLLIGIIGPPGGGKTYSALRLAKGMQVARPGPIVVIDTERGRSRKYAPDFQFMQVDFQPPFVPEEFLHAVQQQLTHKPAAIVIDSLSDEHEGEGGVLDWHDREVPNMSGNEWAAWAKPKASRRKMINGFLQITTPLIFTFRAREKTKTEKVNGKNVPVNIGYQPIAPAEIIYALDLTCILPPRANGVPVWKSDKIGEDFIIKLPKYLQHCFREREELNERTGELLARWAKGDTATPSAPAATRTANPSSTVESKSQSQSSENTKKHLDGLRSAATRGMKTLEVAWLNLPNPARKALLPELDMLKAMATEADNLKGAKDESVAAE